jgi:2,5-diketo-D-gluconate reductase A
MKSQFDGTPRTATGLPFVGFGTYLIANEDAPGAVVAAIEAGYRHIDTAAGYHNEEGVGQGIRRGLAASGVGRADLFVTTKLWPGNAAWGDAPKGYDETIAAFEASLAALGLDYVDLYLIHAPSGGPERVNEWRALVDLNEQGKARAIGVSNYTEAHLEEIRAAGLRGRASPAVRRRARGRRAGAEDVPGGSRCVGQARRHPCIGGGPCG